MAANNRLPIGRTIKLWEEQKGRCIYCNHSLIIGHHKYRPSVEHIVPKSNGGTLCEDNIVLACFHCNCLRGDIDVDVFLDGYARHIRNGEGVAVKIRGPKRWYHGNIIKW